MYIYQYYYSTVIVFSFVLIQYLLYAQYSHMTKTKSEKRPLQRSSMLHAAVGCDIYRLGVCCFLLKGNIRWYPNIRINGVEAATGSCCVYSSRQDLKIIKTLPHRQVFSQR